MIKAIIEGWMARARVLAVLSTGFSKPDDNFPEIVFY